MPCTLSEKFRFGKAYFWRIALFIELKKAKELLKEISATVTH